ncbi:hypothetical protein IHN32_14110 [Deinococcus sp. 14RED07]|uniref:hypothetical protein n=1 Tax=Deinococcus sp. 14RED07 TaxID=2745874 RepID=UPI001E5135EF|nr:hypothetical protein [Deinococcus sp. 14RED07]MCD0177079.1 hypothetical protein [Deinococcus sp. 14RED07]
MKRREVQEGQIGAPIPPAALVSGAGSEVLISGLDTGPLSRDRENLSPTSAQARLHPWRTTEEPTDEDG